MCGIVGYIGPRDATPIILEGLKRLEYRGYDSAGIATLQVNGDIQVRRSVGKLAELEGLLHRQPLAERSASVTRVGLLTGFRPTGMRTPTWG